MDDSIYTQCSIAARRLATEDDPFDESSVVRAAADAEWAEEDFAEADRHAPQVLASLYRNSKLVRFGPVSPEQAPLTGEHDYVRRDGKLLYGNLAAWEGKKLETPNGEFEPISYSHDPLKKNGRRKTSERDDFLPWAEQVPRSPDDGRADVAALRRDVHKYRTALVASEREVDRLRAENSRLRAARASSEDQVTS